MHCYYSRVKERDREGKRCVCREETETEIKTQRQRKTFQSVYKGPF
jgi:hypothetical protein